MKKIMCIILIAGLALLLFGCAGSSNQATEESTVVTELIEAKPVTAVELAANDLDEIKEMMGGQYTSERVQLSNAFSSDGCQYIYNYDVLPGFAFAVTNDEYYGISIMDGAYLNDSISSDMKYVQIADLIGDMDGGFVAQGNNIACNTELDGYNITFCFIGDEELASRSDHGMLTGELLREGNPSLQSIGLRKDLDVSSAAGDDTSDSQAWKQIYSDYVTAAMDEENPDAEPSFALAELDEDAVPELLVDTASHAGFSVCRIEDDEVRTETIGLAHGVFRYDANHNSFYYEYNAQGIAAALYNYENGTISAVRHADSSYDEYSVDGRPVDETEFNEALSSMQSKCPDEIELVSSGEMLAKINAY